MPPARPSGFLLLSFRPNVRPPIPQLLELRQFIIAVGGISDPNDAKVGDDGGLRERLTKRRHGVGRVEPVTFDRHDKTVHGVTRLWV